VTALELRLGSTLSAISCPWRLHLNFSCQVESSGWFSAIKLIATFFSSRPQPVVAALTNLADRTAGNSSVNGRSALQVFDRHVGPNLGSIRSTATGEVRLRVQSHHQQMHP
jgi:hypothetical protein